MDATGSSFRAGDVRAVVSGSVIEPTDPGYDEARRVWNGRVDRHPAVIVRARTTDDIAPSIRFARSSGLQLAVRAGGHHAAGNGTVDDGMVLDLSGLTDVTVDPESRLVHVQGGATLGDVDRATESYDLAVPLGVVSQTGVAGLTLGGGVGWLTRPYGLSADNLVSAQIVTASGDTVEASSTVNPDLFWGVRGGGGNFGVAASFTFRAQPLPNPLFAGNLIYREDNWATALRAYEKWTRDLPDALTSIVSTFVPAPSWDLGDEPMLLIGFLWASPDRARGEVLVDQLRSAAPPDIDAVERVSWTEWQSAADEMFPKGSRAYWRNASFDTLTDEGIDVQVKRGREQSWRGTGFDIHHFGGAFGRVAEEATPFPTRSARFWLNIYGFWADPADDEARIAFIKGFAADMRPFATGGQYVNFMGGEPAHGVPDAAPSVYGPEKLRRLKALKRTWDPENFFRLNHNIVPE